MAVKTWRYYDTYEASDFNRIEAMVQAFYSQFRRSMSLNRPIKVITNRDIYTMLLVEDFNRIEENLAYVDFTGTFEQRTWEEGGAFTFVDANRWELMADLLRRAVAGVQNIRCGTHRCGTWPLYSVIGAVVRGPVLVSTGMISGKYRVIPCGTLPEPSIIAQTIKKEHIVEGLGAAGAYGLDLCGTKPEISVLGAQIQEVDIVTAEGAAATYTLKEAGLDACGTDPEISVVGIVVKDSVEVQAAVGAAAYAATAAGTKPAASTIGKAITEDIVRTAPGDNGKFLLKPAGVKYCGEEVQNGNRS